MRKTPKFASGIECVAACLFAAILFNGCSTDPGRQKLKYLQSGERYFQSQRYQEAIIEFRRSIQADPKFAEAHYQLGRAYLAVNNPDQAYRETASAVALAPDHWDAQLQLASLLISGRQYSQAETTLRKVLGANPSSSQAHILLSRLDTLTRRFSDAIGELEKVVQLDPRRVEAYGAMGAVYLAAGQNEEAEAAYRKGVAVNPQSAEAHIALSRFYVSRSKLSAAELELRTACELAPSAVLPRLELGRVYVAENRTDAAEQLYAELKKSAPNDPQAYQALGLFYQAIGRQDKAAAEFQSLAGAKPQDRQVTAHWIDSLLSLNHIQEAADLTARSLNAAPGDPQLLTYQGRIFLAGGNCRSAQNVLNQAVKADPQAASYYYLGVAQRNCGLPDLARTSLARALELDPRLADAAAALAGLNQKAGDPAEAARFNERALAINPNLPAANLTRIRILLAGGQLQQARGALDEVLKRNPASIPALAILLDWSAKENKTREILPRLEEAARQHPQNAAMQLLLGAAYFDLKDLNRAEACVRQAMSLDPKVPDAYSMLANIDFARGAIGSAKRNLQAAIDANPRNLNNYMALVTQYEKEKDWESAKRFCERAHQVDPSSAFASAELAFLYLEHGGDVNLAVSLAQAVKQKMPASPVAADVLGWSYYKLGSFDSAITELKDSVRKVPGNPLYQYHLGMAYLAIRKYDLASRSLRMALAADPNFLNAANATAALKSMKTRN